MGGGGHKSFGLVFALYLEGLVILKGRGARKVSTLLKGGGRKRFYPVLMGVN